MRLVLQTLLIERVQNGMAGAVGGGAGTTRHRLAIVKRMTAKGTLIDLAFLGPREGNAVVFQLDNRRDGIATHIFDRILVAEPVGPLDGVIHVILPVVALAHIVERSANAALRRNGVGTRWENLGNAGRTQARRRHAKGGAQPGTAGADNNHIIMMIRNFISRHQVNPSCLWFDLCQFVTGSLHRIRWQPARWPTGSPRQPAPSPPGQCRE